MANRTVYLRGWILLPILLLSPLAMTYGDEETLGDLSALQQDIRWLKVTLEHLKLQRELEGLRPTHGGAQKICPSGEGLGALTLNSIYAVNQHYVATFTYHQTPFTARRGERLLCGERVLKITLDGVELEKQGKRYQITGQMAARLMPSLPQTHLDSAHAP